MISISSRILLFTLIYSHVSCFAMEKAVQIHLKNTTDRSLDVFYFHKKNSLSDFTVTSIAPASTGKLASLHDIRESTFIRSKTENGMVTPPISKEELIQQCKGSSILITVGLSEDDPNVLTTAYRASSSEVLQPDTEKAKTYELSSLINNQIERAQYSEDSILMAPASQRSQKILKLFPWVMGNNLHKIVDMDEILHAKSLDHHFVGTSATMQDLYRLILEIPLTATFSSEHVENAYSNILQRWSDFEEPSSSDKELFKSMLLLINTAREGLLSIIAKRPPWIIPDDLSSSGL